MTQIALKKGTAPRHRHIYGLARTMRSLSTDTVEVNTSASFPVGLGSLHFPSPSLVGGLRMAQDYTHTPVLLAEVTDLFAPVPAGVVIDATLGGAGHAQALLASRRDLGLVGVDRDPLARAAAAERLAPFGPRAVIHAGRFSEIGRLPEDAIAGHFPWPSLDGIDSPAPVVGILADLGVSSPQLDRAERGFSFVRPGPLDMRMDPTRGETASEALDRMELEELLALLRLHGEQKYARRIATAILAARPVTTTEQLVEVVDRAVPRGDRRRGNVASRVFQALRVEVNDEGAELEMLLDAAIGMVIPGGRVVVISYHSGEDALVKHTFRRWAEGECTCPPHMPCVCGARSLGSLVPRRAVKAGDAELAENPRSSSARLRCFEVAP